MRLTCKLLVLAVTALATMALGASPASAVEVSDEATGNHCNTVVVDTDHNVSGGCRVRALSEVETVIQAFVSPPIGWVTITTCEDQFEATIGEDGTGVLYNAITSSHAGPACTRRQCDEANMVKIPWPLAVEATTSMEITFCLRNVTDPEGIGGTPCHTNIGITAEENHELELTANGTTFGFCENLPGVRVIGHWTAIPDEAHPAIEIR